MTVLVKPIVAEPRRCYRTHHAQRPFDAPLLPPDPTIGATPRPRRAGPRRGPAGDDPSHCEPDSRPWQAASLALRARAARDASSVRGAVASRLSRRTSRSGPAGDRGDGKIRAPGAHADRRALLPRGPAQATGMGTAAFLDRKSTRLNS